MSATSLFRHGNYDAGHDVTMWDPSVMGQELPASLYLRGRPAWWPAQTPWPWVGPDFAPMTGTLPAKARSDSL